MTKNWNHRYFYLVVFMAVFLTGCVITQGSIQDSIHKSFQVGQGGTLTMDVDKGSIKVLGSDSSSLEVDVLFKVKASNEQKAAEIIQAFPIDFQQNGDDITILAEYKQKGLKKFLDQIKKNLQVEFIIKTPRRYHFDLKTSGGSIGVDDIEGRVTVRTSGGSLSFDHITGPIQGRTSGGSITIGKVRGDAKINTSGGSIRIDQAEGDIDAHTSGGSITVNEVRGNIQADTSGGSIRAFLTQTPSSDCRLTTSGGSITVSMSDDFGINLNARTSGGSVHTDFPFTFKGKLKRNELVAPLNGGGPKFYLRTSGGSIYLKKQ